MFKFSILKEREGKGKGLLMPSPWLFVALPTLLVSVYVWALAAPQYTSSSQFIIRRSNAQTAPMALGLSFLSNQTSTSREDALIIKDYIFSLEMLELLNRELGLVQHFSGNAIDFYSKLSTDATKQDKLEYLADMISVRIDPESSIITLETTAYSPETAASMNAVVLNAAEAFINHISNSLANAQLDFVKEEVVKAENALAKARTATLGFQSKYNILDPESESASLFARISALESQLSSKETELKTLRNFLQENSPQIASLKNEIAALKEQIKEESSVIAGEEELSLNQIMAKYQELKLTQEFVLNTYTSALASLESSRTEAARQIKYLILISDTGIPEDRSGPSRLWVPLTVLALSGLLFLVLRLIIATINDHID